MVSYVNRVNLSHHVPENLCVTLRFHSQLMSLSRIRDFMPLRGKAGQYMKVQQISFSQCPHHEFNFMLIVPV